MSYEQFVQVIETKLQTKVGDERRVYIHQAMKNNGLIRKGITFVEEGINVSPTIYLEEYYERFVAGECVEAIIEQIVQLYKKVRISQSWQCDFVNNYDKVRDKIVIRLVNREANKKMLMEIPCIPLLDLAIIFHVLVELDEQMVTMLITNEHLMQWGISVEEMYKSAVYNSERLLPTEMTNILMIIEELLSEESHSDLCDEEDYMYVLTNDRRSFGASTIIYPDKLHYIGRYLKENYYILPSSVHEVIIVPESRAVGKDELKRMVYEINHTEVPEEERLSDNIYYYDIGIEHLSMI